MSLRYYLAGPMTGLPEFNYPAFTSAADELRRRGFEVVSPHELHDGDTGRSWEFYVRAGLRALLDCDEVVLLHGWHRSSGARLEHTVAVSVGIPCTEYVDLIAAIEPKGK
ncbi:hydrolase [Gordonia phage Gudmit]|nr:hydrolase [Gordonia phage Gudmit]